MGRLGYCIPCGEGRRDVDAAVMVGDDPMCDMHARMMGDGHLVKLPLEERTVTLVMTKSPEATRMFGDAIAKRLEQARGLVEAELEQVVDSLAESRLRTICSRGCGKQSHRGRCRGAAPPPLATLRKFRQDRTEQIVQSIAPLPAISPLRLSWDVEDVTNFKPSDRKGRVMDRLVADEFDIAEVPKTTLPARAPMGRAGELWERFQALAPGKALKVACRDKTHVGTTARSLNAKAKEAGIGMGCKRMPVELWVWRE